MIEKDELKKRVEGYLKRMKTDNLTETHDLEKEGFYRIVGGTEISMYASRKTLDIVHGRFIDAVAYGVQQPGFLGDWCSWENNYDNCNHGKIEKVAIVEFEKDTSLDSLVSSWKVKNGRR